MPSGFHRYNPFQIYLIMSDIEEEYEVRRKEGWTLEESALPSVRRQERGMADADVNSNMVNPDNSKEAGRVESMEESCGDEGVVHTLLRRGYQPGPAQVMKAF